MPRPRSKGAMIPCGLVSGPSRPPAAGRRKPAPVALHTAALLLLPQRPLLGGVAVLPERLQLAPPDAQLIKVHVHQLGVGPARELGDQQDDAADRGRSYSSRLEKP